MSAWRRAGYPLVSRYPSWDHELLPYTAAPDALDDQARQTAIRLGSQGWVGTPEQLVSAALAITIEEHH